MERAQADGDLIREEAQQTLNDAIAERAAMQEALEPEIIEMIIGITEKLLGNIVEVNPAIIVNLVKQGFAAAAISGDVKVNVSAEDYDAVSKSKNELLALTDGASKVTVVKDLSLSPMDCVIETEFGNIDCSLGQQFESLKANLTYILNNK
jgi:flagellar assembly protein FliH